MMRALSRLRSVTARRQLRWIIWGSGVGAVPFVLLYVGPYLAGHTLPYAEYTAVLLGTQTATAIMTDQRDVADYDVHWNELEPLAAWGDAARSVIAQAAGDYRSIA